MKIKLFGCLLIFFVSNYALNERLEQGFTHVFEHDGWGKGESKSGGGSSLFQTRIIRERLPHVLKQYNIKTFLDASCGDFFWMNKVDLSGLDQYVGMDIVKKLIESNVSKYTRSNVSFFHGDVTTDQLPSADLALCRDCLVHLSFEDIARAINNLKKANITYLLTTNFPKTMENKNITAGWRTINLEKPPFNLPQPLLSIEEGCTECEGIYKDKSLALWKLDDLEYIDVQALSH